MSTDQRQDDISATVASIRSRNRIINVLSAKSMGSGPIQTSLIEEPESE